MGVDAIICALVPKRLTDEEIKRAAVHAQVVIGDGHVLQVSPPHDGTLSWSPREGQHSLVRADAETLDIYFPDRPDGRNKTWLWVNTRSSYYGPNYERGPIVTILALAKFLRHRWKGTEVYYGGDTGGDVSLLDQKREAALWDHLFGPEGRDYFQRSGFGAGRAVHCDFCDLTTSVNMGGGVGSYFGCYCNSCNRHWLVEGGRVTLTKADYRTSLESKDEVEIARLPLVPLRAILQQLRDGDPAGHAAVELEMLLARSGVENL